MFASYLKSISIKPTLEEVTKWYKDSMMTKTMKWYFKKDGKKLFTKKKIENLKKTEKLKSANKNPYSWNMEFYMFDDEKGFETRFTKCGICHLLKELDLFEFTPAMCKLDYDMANAMLVTNFKREYTLASNGPYCDGSYYKKDK